MALSIPEPVRGKARAVGAAAWLADLPGLVEQVSREWALALGRAYQDATEAFVTEATLDDGTPVVLKLPVPRTDDLLSHEATVLRLVDGDGCVRLLRHHAPTGAMLLERLGPSLHELALPVRRRHEVLCDLARRVWRRAPGCGLPTGAEKAGWLASFIVTTWNELDRPCSEAAVEYALRCARRRLAAHDDERAVLVHGDVHQWNALRTSDGFALVDPDGLLAEAEYDLGVLMREDPAELLSAGDPFRRARWLAARTGTDATAIWEWGAAERVSTGLICTSIGLQPVGRQMLAAAEHATLHAAGRNYSVFRK